MSTSRTGRERCIRFDRLNLSGARDDVRQGVRRAHVDEHEDEPQEGVRYAGCLEGAGDGVEGVGEGGCEGGEGGCDGGEEGGDGVHLENVNPTFFLNFQFWGKFP